MIVDAKVSLRADALPPRARRARKVHAEETIPVRLREATADEAPVALRPMGEDGERFDVRFHDGRLWVAATRSPASWMDDDGTPQAALARFAETSGIDISRSESTTRVPFEEGWRTVSSHRDFVAPLLQEFVDAELLQVDGVPHARIRSPLVVSDHVRAAFGKAGATREVPVSDDDPIPAWFAPAFPAGSFPEFPTGREVRPTDDTRTALRLLDVEFVRPDLVDVCRRSEAANTDPDGLVSDLMERFYRDPRTHGSVGISDSSVERSAFAERIALSAYRKAAEDGAGFAEAAAAARSTMDPVDVEPRDPSAFLLPMEGTASTKSVRIFFQGGSHGRALLRGWSETGAGPRIADVEMAVLDPASTTEIAVVGSDRYLVDADGAFHVDPAWKGRSWPNGPDAKTIHAADVAKEAWRHCERGERSPSPHGDHVGAALRHPNGVLPLLDDEDRRRTLGEFSSTRMGMLGERLVYRCPEPVIAVLPDRGSKARVWTSRSTTLRAVPGELPPFLFRLDRRDDASALFRGPVDPSAMPVMDGVDADRLSFDGTLWNLRAAMMRIVGDVDARIAFMSGDAVASLVRVGRHVGTWAADASLVSGDAAVDAFLQDVLVVLAELEHPLFEDIGDEPVRETARSSLDAMTARRPSVEPIFDEELADLRM